MLAIASGQAAISELLPILRDPQVASLRMGSLIEGAITPAASTYSHKAVLRVCLETVTSVYARLQPHDRYQALLDACTSIGGRVVALTPTSGFGWLVLGAVAAGRGDMAGAADALGKSAAVAPHEYWLARLRSGITEDHYAELGGPLARSEASDLAITLQGLPGRTELAQRYWRDEAFRERITGIAEQLDDRQQQLFLSAVKQAQPRNGQ